MNEKYEYSRSKYDVAHFAETWVLPLVAPDHKNPPFKLTDEQRVVLLHMDAPRLMVNATRQTGKTLLGLVKCLHEFIFTGGNVLFVGWNEYSKRHFVDAINKIVTDDRFLEVFGPIVKSKKSGFVLFGEEERGELVVAASSGREVLRRDCSYEFYDEIAYYDWGRYPGSSLVSPSNSRTKKLTVASTKCGGNCEFYRTWLLNEYAPTMGVESFNKWDTDFLSVDYFVTKEELRLFHSQAQIETEFELEYEPTYPVSAKVEWVHASDTLDLVFVSNPHLVAYPVSDLEPFEKYTTKHFKYLNIFFNQKDENSDYTLVAYPKEGIVWDEISEALGI